MRRTANADVMHGEPRGRTGSRRNGGCPAGRHGVPQDRAGLPCLAKGTPFPSKCRTRP